MAFYAQADSSEPCLLYYLPCYPVYYPPCYPQYGHNSGMHYCDPGANYNCGYQPYSYGSRCSSTSSMSPCSYGYRYTHRGSCYEPCGYRLGYGARRNFPSRRYGPPNLW